MKNKKIQLNLSERILIPSILKKESTFDIITINNDIENKVKITQTELKNFAIKVVKQIVTWNNKGQNSLITVEFTELELNEIKSCLMDLNNEKKITNNHISLYKKFVQ